MSNDAPLLELDGVDVEVNGKKICSDISLCINEGETHVLLGPNGSGKSSLLHAIMGIRPFSLIGGRAQFCGRDLHDIPLDERARLGIGMAFQRPPRMKGVTVEALARALGARDAFRQGAEKLGLHHLNDREVNCGFSGGETKRWEVLKLTAQNPLLCLLDEPESGVDLEQVTVVGNAINELMASPGPDGRLRGGIVITHTGFILNSIDAARAHLMVDGQLVGEGAPSEMFERIRTQGYMPASAR